jgi:hypothetical protein
MSLSSEYKQRQSNGQVSIFKQGVRDARLCNKNAVSVFRLMPAFNPEDPNPETSWMPAITPDGEATDWGKLITTCTFIGYGQNKRSLVSPKTLDRDAPCPLHELWNYIRQDKATWGYMIEGSDNMDNVFKKPGDQMVINAVDVNKTNLGVVLGILNKSASESLYKLVTARNTNQMLLSMVEQNYLAGFANGDLSDPQQGMQLACQVDASKKKTYAEYAVSVLTSTDPRTKQETVSYFPVNGPWLSLRYNLYDPMSYLNIKSYEDIVLELIGLFNRRSPAGHHEFDLLREAFDECKELVPAAPSAPAAHGTVAPGWQAPGRASAPTQFVAPPVMAAPMAAPVMAPPSPELAHLQKAATNIPPPPAMATSVHVPGDPIPAPAVEAGGNAFVNKLRGKK